MKKISYLLLTMLVVSSLGGITHPSPGKWSLSGEYLCMLNSTDQPYFAQEMSLEAGPALLPFGTRFANEQKWHSGYRIEGMYGLCNCFSAIDFRWTHFPSFTEQRTLTDPSVTFDSSYLENIVGLRGVTVPANVIALSDRYDYYSLEGLFQYSVIDNRPITMFFDVGIQYAHIHLKENLFIQNTLGSILFNSTYLSKRDAVGLEMGFEFEWLFRTPFSLNVRGLGSLLASNKKSQYNDLLNASTLFSNSILIKDENYWVVIPAINMRAGINYDRRLCSHVINVEIGYEFIDYFNGIDRIFNYFPQNNTQVNSFNEYRDFVLHGLYVHLGLAF